MKTSTDFIVSLGAISNEVNKTILELLKKNNIDSINVTPYITENFINTFYFYDCDKNGNGEALEVCSIEVKDNKIILEMDTNFGDYFGTYVSTDFTASEQIYLLEMIENILQVVEYGDAPLLKKDEYFDENF